MKILDRTHTFRLYTVSLALLCAAIGAVFLFNSTPAFADRHEEGEEEEEGGFVARAPKPANAAQAAAQSMAATAMKNECGSCHVPYPARLLPAAGWQKIMGNLGDHFGTDASIDDPKTTKLLTDFLVANAGNPQRITDSKGSAVPTRITQTGWFVREHDEVRASTWKRPSIKSPANCGACHQGAADGNFSEHSIRIPKQ